MKAEEIIDNLKQLTREAKQKYKARIKGISDSFVREEERSESDEDVFFEFENDADLINFVGLSILFEENLGLKVDVVSFDAIRPEIRENILKEAIYL
ncbi:MAG: nucleotidyltransferase [Thermoplasmata archaeon]